MIKEKIEQYLKSEFTELLSNEKDFYFQKGQDALQKWLNLSVSVDDKTDLENLASDYEGLQVLANQRVTINDILNLLFEIVSYCDSKAKDKTTHNQYNDNRTLAMAYVRMNHWIEKLILFKFSPNNVPVGSILNAINYLLDPPNKATILSENHRAMISKSLLKKEYVHNDFIKDLEQYFKSYQIVVSNPNNYTYLLSCIIYNIKKEWLDDVIGLMASDNTIWKDDLINDMNGDDCTILWNSKRPTGTNNTLKMLRNKINNDEYFKLFYSVHGSVQYVAEIIDFVENDNQLKQKNWPSKFNKIVWYQDDFAKYKDDNKSARIVFLAKNFYKINAIPASEFEVYKDYSYPTQDNLTPIISEPDMTIIPPTTTITTPDMRNNYTNSLNQILYGPPGTGKTYNTINKAISIINLDFDLTQARHIVKKEFDRLVSDGLVVFTTFHQSMSYEDFIEGIKPKTKGTDVIYEIEDGIFKKIADEARINWLQSKNANNNFEVLFEQLKKEWQESENSELRIPMKSSYFDIIDIREKNIDFRKSSGGTGHDLVISTLKDIYLGNRVMDSGLAVYYYPLVEKLKTYKTDSSNVKLENYVLIIDEINRGNVSQIFGELITLIEGDKRLGEKEALEVILPYSKEKFGVPLNLYIIGTMNTADRSVEALDTALRRRFSFEEMMPLTELLSPSALYCQLLWNYETVGWDDPEFKEKEDQFFDFAQVSEDFKNKRKEIWEIIKADYIKDDFSYFEEFDYNGFNLQAILEKINNRIEILLNRDHLIGHSYFLKVNTEEQLKASFKNNIIPLLQEYFYGDYEKIGMIIGSGFFDETEKYVNEDFASFTTQNYPESGSLLRFKTIDEDFDIVDAMKKLLNVKEEKKTDA